MPEAEVSIRECSSVDDFQQCIRLERVVWGDDDIGIMPIRLYLISKACRAPTIGAFDSAGRLVGFVHTMLALIGRNVVYHSHLAAVLEEYRHQDIGFRMKLAQRQFALDSGVPLIIWTFDPLQSRNAHLNINKLGAVVRRYEPDYYGEGLSTVFGEGVPSDRVFAEWWVKSGHVEAVLNGQRPRLERVEGHVTIPEDVDAVHRNSIDDHLRWRLRVRREFATELARGMIARGFERDSANARSRYLFGVDQEQFTFGSYNGVQAAGTSAQ